MASLDYDNPATPVNCEDVVLPTGLAREDCFTPELNFGPGTEVYWGAVFPNPTSGTAPTPTAAEITAALAAGTLIGPIVAQVSYSAPTDNTIRVAGKDYPRPTDLVANITIANTTDKMVEFARTTQKGGLTTSMFVVDANPNWFGGRNGMFGGPGILALRYNIPEGEDDLQTITGTFKRRGYFDARRDPSPVPTLQTT